jgi:hypothetical protein
MYCNIQYGTFQKLVFHLISRLTTFPGLYDATKFRKANFGGNILLHVFETDVLKGLLNKMSLWTRAFLIVNSYIVVRLRMTGAMPLLPLCACKAWTRTTIALPLP